MNRFYLFVLAVFSFFHPMKIVGREHIPSGATVVCANHTGLSDPLFAVRAVGVKDGIFIMAKEEIRLAAQQFWPDDLGQAGKIGYSRHQGGVSRLETGEQAGHFSGRDPA